METRRENLRILAAISATCAYPFSADELFGQEHAHPAPGPVPPAGPSQPKFFTDDEVKLISRISDLIIPPTGTPGAISAGVPQYIDSVVSGNPAMQKRFRSALPQFGSDFLTKLEPDQLALLQPLCEAADAGRTPAGSLAELFHEIKNLTCDGYYTSQAGLVQELGYSGNTARESFPPCIHEH